MEMFVYFDDSGNIVSIGPCEDKSFSNINCQKFPLHEVSHFLEGKAQSTAYIVVKKIGDNPFDFEIKPRKIEIESIKTLDRFLAEVTVLEDAALVIENNIRDKVLKITLNEKIRAVILRGNEYNEGNITISGLPEMDLFFTKKGDPSFLVSEFIIQVSTLLAHGEVTCNYTINIDNCSLYTKKIFETYSYKVVM